MGLIIKPLTEAILKPRKITALIYCAPGVGKSTALGIIAKQSKGRTLVLDVDRTFVNAMAKVGGAEKVDIIEIDNVKTFEDWKRTLEDLDSMNDRGELDYENIAVDNISELERCILSDLGRQGKNRGVPAQADYQYMQVALVNSLRGMKTWGKNIFWTAWETTEQFQNPDGSYYTRLFPKVSAKILDNICGLCDVVAKIHVNKDGARGFIMEATQNTYAKNQLDDRKVCRVENFIKNEKGED